MEMKLSVQLSISVKKDNQLNCVNPYADFHQGHIFMEQLDGSMIVFFFLKTSCAGNLTVSHSLWISSCMDIQARLVTIHFNGGPDETFHVWEITVFYDCLYFVESIHWSMDRGHTETSLSTI